MVGFVALLLCGAPEAASAGAATPDKAPRLDVTARAARDGYVKVDGFVTDWDGVAITESRTLTRAEPEFDWTGPRDLSVLVQAQYDSRFLYLAIEVRDNIVTGPKGRDRGDRVEVWLDAGPVAEKSPGGRLRMLEIGLGDLPEGGASPEVSWQFPRAMKGKAPEGLLKDGSMREAGYFFELGIPLEEVSQPAPGLEPFGVAVIARDLDRDDPNEDEAAVATAPFDALKARDVNTMGQLILSGAQGVLSSFERHLPEARGLKPTTALWADVGGDTRRERVSLIKHWLVVTGVGLGDGDFYYYTMPNGPHITFKSLELRELTGDDKDELLVTYELDHGQVKQTCVAIYHYDLDRIKVIFNHELANHGPGWSITNELSFKPAGKGKPTLIVVTSSDKVQGVDAGSYIDVDAQEIVNWERLMLPWEANRKRTFEWGAGQFLRQ